jgi:hypothetical protein
VTSCPNAVINEFKYKQVRSVLMRLLVGCTPALARLHGVILADRGTYETNRDSGELSANITFVKRDVDDALRSFFSFFFFFGAFGSNETQAEGFQESSDGTGLWTSMAGKVVQGAITRLHISACTSNPIKFRRSSSSPILKAGLVRMIPVRVKFRNEVQRHL